MATAEQIARLRLLVDEPAISSAYTDEALGSYVDVYGLFGAAAEVWRHKAAEWAELVNTSEGDASRNMSDLLAHAQQMLAYYEQAASQPENLRGRTVVKKIVRS